MTHNTNWLSKLKAAAIYLCSLVLCGCSTPQVIGKFQGLKTIQAASDNLHIILVHGISKHDPGWSDDFYKELVTTLKLQNVGDGDWDKCIFIPGEGKLDEPTKCIGGNVPPTADGVLKSVTLQTPDKLKKVTITEVTWSPITTALKQNLLAYDKVGDVSKSRAWANKFLRENLVDDAFSDALAYVGEPGERIRDVVWKGICYSMTGKLADSEACDLGQDNHRFAFITHSLGSRVVFDALHVGEDRLLQSKKYAAIAEVSSNTVALYMLANQLPLLEMADDTGAKISTFGFSPDKSGNPRTASSLGRFLKEREAIFSDMKTKLFIKMPEGKKLPPVSIAAFSDPNDILSYSLCHSNMPELGDVNVADVWVKNAFSFGLFANPKSAHQGYWKNEGVINLLVGEDVTGEQKCGAAANGSNQVAK